ncbi:MAG: prolyl oligopeptidase family serine peptidase, partial [Planctomycetota bacterium JB042]
MRPITTALLVAGLGSLAAAGDGSPPDKRALKKIVPAYLEADAAGRAAMRAEFDRDLRPLYDREVKTLRVELLKLARREGKRLSGSGRNFWYDEKEKLGKYIVEGKPSKTLWIGLHGGGLGSGDAGSMAAGMGGGGWWWIFPEVLKKTERGWTDSGTEEFVLELVEAAKRTGKVDPNRVYVSGHSMGGYGTWTFLAHHPDVFAGGAAYAGAPTMYYKQPGAEETFENIDAVVDGILPNLFNSRLFVFQSTDDKNVPPGPNQFAAKSLGEWRQAHPDGFDFRYEEVDDRGHAAPKEGYLPSQKWVAEHERVARPRKLIWQPVLPWKRQFHWLRWEEPTLHTTIRVEAKEGNRVEITSERGEPDLSTLSLLLGEPIVDLDEEVVVVVDGEETFRGKVD